MNINSSIQDFERKDFIFAFKHEFLSNNNLWYLLVSGIFLMVLLIALVMSHEVDIIFCICAYLFIFSFYFCFYLIFLAIFIVSAVSNYRLLNRLKKPNRANEWKMFFLSTTFTSVYHLLLARSYSILSDTEYAVKKHELVNKMYITNDSFMVLAKYYNFLSINDIEFAKQKQNFLANNEKISNKNLMKLVNENIITQEESKYKKVNLDDKVFLAICLSAILYLIGGANYLFHIF